MLFCVATIGFMFYMFIITYYMGHSMSNQPMVKKLMSQNLLKF